MPISSVHVIADNFLHQNGYNFNPNLLIIGENYPRPLGGPNWQYFYRSVYPYPTAGNNTLFNTLCDHFGVPQYPTELQRLHAFLQGAGTGQGRRLLIDTLEFGVPINNNYPYAPHPIDPVRLVALINDITYINPNHIIFLHNRQAGNGKDPSTISNILGHPGFAPFIPRIIQNPNPKVNQFVFPYPAQPADPHVFSALLNTVRGAGYNI